MEDHTVANPAVKETRTCIVQKDRMITEVIKIIGVGMTQAVMDYQGIAKSRQLPGEIETATENTIQRRTMNHSAIQEIETNQEGKAKDLVMADNIEGMDGYMTMRVIVP
jgi:hypothetical protein